MKLPDDDKPEQPPGQRPCMDDYEYNTWEFWNNRTMAKDTALSPCEDCTVDYSREMAKIGLCDGTPTIVINTKPSPAEAARVHAHKAAWSPERREKMSRLMKKRNLDPAWQSRARGGRCAEDKCKEDVHSKGLCRKHYAKSMKKQRKEHK